MHEALRFPKPFGKYMLLRQLAVGGMAEVYLARASGPAGFEKECVIKRILPSLASDAQFVQMFLDEARIAARLSHPNIVQIFELGEVTPHDHFIAMEYVHGVDVQQILESERARSGRVPLAIALKLVSNVAEGLDAAHRATDSRGQALGIVHRDVTPSNVIVSFDGVAKILDFGIAKAVAKNGRTEVGVIKGKIPYMSPEQVDGQPLDARSDMFSLGVLLYELTTGHKPFDGQSPAEISIKILHDEPSPPEVLLTHYPGALALILRRAMAKKPDDRFGSARELQLALEEFLVGSGVRCSSHEVSAYLEELFPGRREELQIQAGATGPLPAGTDPTVPMMLTGKGPVEGVPQPISQGDLSNETAAFDGARRNLGGGGPRGTTFVVFALIAAVAVGFWYLRGHLSPEAAPAQPGASAPPPTVHAAPAPEQATPPKPAPEAPPAAAATEKPTEKPAELENPPAVAKPAAPAPAPAPLKPVEAAKPAPEKPHPTAARPSHKPAPHKPTPAKHEPADRPLPHLPTPPPADDGE
jgi:serine/threonine-protein kinase